MKHIIAIVLSLAALPIAAQSTDSLRREVTIVKDYTPVVKEVTKINSMPPVSTPTFSRREVTYRYDATPSPINVAAGNIAVPAIESTRSNDYRKGYIDFGLGTYMAMAGNAGYHILDNAHDRLNIAAQFTSLNRDIPVNTSFIPVDDEAYEQATRQTFYDTRVGLHYDHRFASDVTVALNAAYRFLNFNYYGVCGTLPTNRDSHPFQWSHNMAVELQVHNREALAYDYSQWNITAGYTLYSNRWGAYVHDPSAEHHGYLRGSLGNDLGNGWSAGGEVNLDVLQYSGVFPSGELADNAIHNPRPPATSSQTLFMAELLPHVAWNGSRVHFRAGLRAYVSVCDGTIFRFAPDVHFNWEFVRNYFVYAHIGGGKRLHTWHDVSQGCIYFDPSRRIPSTYSPLDARAGIRFNIVPQFSLAAYAGYEIAAGALFHTAGLASQAIAWSTIDACCVKAGARVDVTPCKLIGFMGDVTYRRWRNDEGFIAYDRPVWEANARIKLRPHERFIVEVGYNMQLGRDYGSPGRLADIHNLQASVSYRPIEQLSIFVNGNNLLNRRHDLYYGLPAPRLQVMGGVGLTF